MSRLKTDIAKILAKVGINTTPENIRQNRHRSGSPIGFRVRADYKKKNGYESWSDYESYYTLTEFMAAYRKFGLPDVEGSIITFLKNTTGEGFASVGYE